VNDLTLICETCGFPVAGDTGCIYVAFDDVNAVRAYERSASHADGTAVDVADLLTDPGPVHWRTRHWTHPEDRDCYEIGADRISTWPQFAHWTAHLMEKNWFALSDWDDLLREAAGDIPPSRIRIAAREAA
jgi:hypothetical protein